MAWTTNKLAGTVRVDNFDRDWNDGRAVACLVDAVGPGLFPDCEKLDPMDAVNNAWAQQYKLLKNGLGFHRLEIPRNSTLQ